MSKYFFVILGLLVLSLAQTPEEDQVFPSDDLRYTHPYYSGYLPMTISNTIHYAFFESQNNTHSNPLILYLAGGPGCSSLLGAFHQNGPFLYHPGNSTLDINPYAWNKNASVLYLQYPAGVGFSQSTQTKQITDEIAMHQLFSALRSFYGRFPMMRKNDLFLTGHGFAAVFHTYLAKRIIDHNEDPFQSLFGKINLQGIFLGNPCTLGDECYPHDQNLQSSYHYQFLYKHGFYSQMDYNQFIGACRMDNKSSICYQTRQKLDKKFADTNTSQYNIYGKCYKNVTIQGQNVINTGCEDYSSIVHHFNMDNIKESWNVNSETHWTPCSQDIIKRYTPSGNNSYWLYPQLIKKGLHIWIFSGDLDSDVPLLGTKKWIERLKQQLDIPVRRNWRQWWVPGLHKHEDQVGGYIWELKGLTFVTVKGAGFFTAKDKPIAMQQVLNGFLSKTTLPFKTV